MEASLLRQAFIKRFIVDFDTNLYKTQEERDWAYICKRYPHSPYRLDNIIMTSYSKDSAIHFLWQIYSWAGEFSSLKKWFGGLWSLPSLPPTSMSAPFSSKNTAKNSLICVTLEKNSTWAEREIKYSENAIKSSTLKTSDLIQLIQVHLNYFLCFLYHLSLSATIYA